MKLLIRAFWAATPKGLLSYGTTRGPLREILVSIFPFLPPLLDLPHPLAVLSGPPTGLPDLWLAYQTFWPTS